MAVNLANAAFARRAIEAAGKSIGPGVTEAQLASHGSRLIAGTAATAAPAELTGAAVTKAAPSAPPVRTARPASPRPSRVRSVASSAGSFAGEAAGQSAEAIGSAATGGLVKGDSALGRIFGAVVIGLGTLIVGSMFRGSKGDFAINLGTNTPAPKETGPRSYVPLYGPSAGVAQTVPTQGVYVTDGYGHTYLRGALP